MKRLLPLICLVFGCLGAAEPTLVNGDFELNDKGWSFPECAHTESFTGCDGTAALLLQRDTPAKKDESVCSERMPLQPGHYYTLEAWVRCETLQGGAPQLGVEFATGKKGKEKLPSVSKSLTIPADAQEWTRLCLDFMVPPQATFTRVTITYPQKVTGNTWLDKLSVKPANYPFALALLYPLQGFIDEHNPVLRIAVAKPGEFNLTEELLHKTIRLNRNGHPQALRTAAPIVEFSLEPPLPQDFLNATVELLDNDTQRVHATLRISLRILHGLDPLPPEALTIDALYRATLHGQPFLPLGIVADHPTQQLADSPFQCILPSRKAIDAIHSPAEFKQFLDDCWTQRRHVMLPIDDDCWPWLNDLTPIVELRRERLLADFASHPAVLAWQLASTANTDGAVHRYINQTDHFHPLCQMLDDARLPGNFMHNGDVLGVHIEAPVAGHAEDALVTARLYMDELATTQFAPWIVMHCPVDGTATPEELRALTLLLAARGAKGFFYDPTPLADSMPMQEEQINRHFDLLADLARNLQELSPFLLSDVPSRNVPISVTKGDAIAREFTTLDGKRVILLIGGLRRGKTQATLNLPKNAIVTSRFGATKPQRNGVWNFQGKGLCADILEIEATK